MKLSKFKKWHKTLLVILLFFIIILFIAPRAGQRYVEKNSKQLIGRKIDIAKIRINYFTGTIRIKGLKVFEKDDTSRFVGFNKLIVNIDYWPFFRQELVISEISLVSLVANIEQNGSTFNFSDLIVQESPKDTLLEPDSIMSKPMLLTFNDIRIEKSKIQYTDKELGHTISLNDINLHIPGFSLNNGSTNLNIDFDFTDGGELHSKLDLNQDDSTYHINLRLDSLNLDIIEPYIKNSMAISEINGYFSNNIVISGHLLHIMQLSLKGQNNILAFEMIDNHERDILHFENFTLDIDTLLLAQNLIKINEIALVNPYFFVELADSTNNWSAMLLPPDTLNADTIIVEPVTDTSSVNEKETKDFDYFLTRLTIQDGEVLFNDKTLQEEFTATINQINISSKDITAKSKDVEINLNALVNNTAQIITKVNLDPYNAKNIKLDFALQNFAMKYTEPYLMHYLGYPVKEGLMNFKTNNILTENTLHSESNIYVRNFTLGDPNKKQAQVKVPLKLVVGILSNKNNIIDLKIPVESRGESISIRNLGKIIFTTLGNLIVKAAASPVDFLADLYGVNPEKVNVIKLGMFDKSLNEDDFETLDIIAKILQDKPKLLLELNYGVNKNLYYDSLATSLAFGQFQESYSENIRRTPKHQQDSLFYAYLLSKLEISQSDKNSKELSKEFIGNQILVSQLDSTSKVHQKLIRDYLLIQKSIPEQRLKFLQGISDITNDSLNDARFNVNFKSGTIE